MCLMLLLLLPPPGRRPISYRWRLPRIKALNYFCNIGTLHPAILVLNSSSVTSVV